MKIGAYEVLGDLGTGGMGRVYRARDPQLRRDVALKVLEPGSPPDLKLRFVREGRTGARLKHPGIVSVHAAGEADGYAYIVQELVEGSSLAGEIEQGALAPGRAAALLEKVARALHYAHGEGVIHRDVKPGNILLDRDREPHLADFGLARDADASAALSRSGQAIGTPHYRAPAQAGGRVGLVDARTDVWACGVVLYECLTSARPFEGGPHGVMEAILWGEPTPLSRRGADVPAGLSAIVERCLEKEPGGRYPSALALAEDLARFLRGEPVQARSASQVQRLARRIRRNPAPWVVGAGAAAALAAGAGVLVPGALSERAGREEAEGAAASAREEALRQLRKRAALALEGALALRRKGLASEMARFAREAEEACAEAIQALPGEAEPHYRLGRMHRALLRDDEALAEQERALAIESAYAPARYERVVLLSRRLRERADRVWREGARREGERLAREGGGTVRAGEEARVPFWADAVGADPIAGAWRRTLASDLAAVEAGGGVPPGAIACARALRTWLEGDNRGARRILEEAVRAEEPLEEAYEALASLCEGAGRFEEAVRWWTEGFDRDLGYTPHLEGRGRTRNSWGLATARAGGDASPIYRAAVEDLSEVIHRDPGRVSAWGARGAARVNGALHVERRGEDPVTLYEEAIGDLDEALRRAPDEPEPRVHRGNAQVNLAVVTEARGGDPRDLLDRAVADYDEVLRRNDSRDDVWDFRASALGNRANFEAARGRDARALFERALSDHGEALRRNPTRAALWTGRGATRFALASHLASRAEDPTDRYRDAVSDLGEAIRLDPRPEEPWMRRGLARGNWGNWVWIRGGDPTGLYAEAIGDLDEAISRNPRRSETWLARGNARLSWANWRAERGDDPRTRHAEALADLDRAIELNAANALAWKVRGTARHDVAAWKFNRQEDGTPDARAALGDLAEAVRRNPTLAPAVGALETQCRAILARGAR
ncbi:MAG: serine/threonine protein kinase [Planctomycetales bacterium]|nr:serine/threonine protein kinase [Planctomycetales bacterium]